MATTMLADRGSNPLAVWEPIDWTDSWTCKAVDTAAPDDAAAAFESEVSRNPYSLKLWVLYLESRRTSSTASRFVLYERAMKFVPTSYKLWYRYLEERLAAASNVAPDAPSITAINNVFERCLVNMSTKPRIWLMYLKFLQSQPVVTKTRRCFDRALQSLPVTQHHRVWEQIMPWAESVDVPQMAVALHRRFMMLEPSKVGRYVDLLTRLERWDEAAVVLANTLNEEVVYVEGKTLHQLWMDLCRLICSHPKSIVSLDIEAVMRTGLRRFADQVGFLWCSLARHFILLNNMDKARDIFEEAMESVSTANDFGLVFDAYAKFTEGLATGFMERAGQQSSVEVDMALAQLENLLARRPVLLSSVKIRQNPHNVVEWLNRVQLFADDPAKVLKTFSEAVLTVDPYLAVGSVTILWVKFAQYYESHGGLESMREVFERAVKARFRTPENLASVWCTWVETELRHKWFKRALEVARRALHKPSVLPPSVSDVGEVAPNRGLHQQLMCRSVRMWSLCMDLEESYGTPTTLKACVEKMLDLKVITPAQLLNYAAYLQENRFWESSFQIYERGVAVFRWPHSYDVWVAYLSKFLGRYGGRKLERARELFEQCVVDAPSHLAKRIFLLYGKLEEEFGLARHAIAIYERAAAALEDANDIFDLYCLLVAKASEFYGITRTRPIFERGVERLCQSDASAPLGVRLALRFVDVERGLGEIDRARAILVHASQFCDPKNEATVDLPKDESFTELRFWQKWRKFEIAHGNEETFKDMLRIKRSVQAVYAHDTIREIAEAAKQKAEMGGDAAAVAPLEPAPSAVAMNPMMQLEAAMTS